MAPNSKSTLSVILNLLSDLVVLDVLLFEAVTILCCGEGFNSVLQPHCEILMLKYKNSPENAILMLRNLGCSDEKIKLCFKSLHIFFYFERLTYKNDIPGVNM
jgi:hypothetical protein